MAMLTQHLRELQAACEQAQKDIQAQIKVERSSLEGLAHLKDKILSSKAGAFDSDDVCMVDEEIQEHTTQLQKLERELEKAAARHAAHATVFIDMAHTLSDRSSILDEESEVLAKHPQLLERFAKKQVDLETMLKSKVQELSLTKHTDNRHSSRTPC